MRQTTELVGLGDAALGVVGLGAGDRRDLGADHREDDDDDAGEEDRRARWGRSRRASVRLLKSSRPPATDAEDEAGSRCMRKTMIVGDLDAGEPVLELTEATAPRTGSSPSSAP
ncbi:MAG: hypothetical protein V9G19_18360 [Tetrasphaera sp.]